MKNLVEIQKKENPVNEKLARIVISVLISFFAGACLLIILGARIFENF